MHLHDAWTADLIGLGDAEVGARAELADQVLGVDVQVLGPRVAVGRGRDADAEIAGRADEFNELVREFEAARRPL